MSSIEDKDTTIDADTAASYRRREAEIVKEQQWKMVLSTIPDHIAINTKCINITRVRDGSVNMQDSDFYTSTYEPVAEVYVDSLELGMCLRGKVGDKEFDRSVSIYTRDSNVFLCIKDKRWTIQYHRLCATFVRTDRGLKLTQVDHSREVCY